MLGGFPDNITQLYEDFEMLICIVNWVKPRANVFNIVMITSNVSLINYAVIKTIILTDKACPDIGVIDFKLFRVQNSTAQLLKSGRRFF